nr:hypothetical protein [uncultured Paludibaculum sp.]
MAWTAALAATVSMAQAHFVFVVPDAGGGKAKVILGETLEPDKDINVKLIGGTRLSLRSLDGRENPLTLTLAERAYEVTLGGQGLRVVHGVTDFGVTQRGTSKAHILIYHPKTIVGDAFDARSVVGGDTPVEIVPVGRPGALQLKLLAHGKPLPDAEVTVLLPGGGEKKVKTDASGLTEVFTPTGRYGAWARFWEPGTGDRDGKKYEELRHYATLVFDAAPVVVAARSVATLPEATSSFGAVESGGWLYVYGGHIAPTHNYWEGAVSGRFARLELGKPGSWVELAAGPALQGLNLAALDGRIYRVGGMAPRNRKGEATDNRSTAECAQFDAAQGQWTALPALPEPRSSHDVVAVGRKLIVTGGWDLQGSQERWMDTTLVLDLAARAPRWKSVPQPFRRRALIAAAYQGKVYVIGGFNEKGEIERSVSILDPAAGAWTDGPKLPEGVGGAFAPAAAVHEGRLYASVSDGSLLRLDEAGRAWEKVGRTGARVAHRMVSSRGQLLVLGGAAGGRNLDSIEMAGAGTH